LTGLLHCVRNDKGDKEPGNFNTLVIASKRSARGNPGIIRNKALFTGLLRFTRNDKRDEGPDYTRNDKGDKIKKSP